MLHLETAPNSWWSTRRAGLPIDLFARLRGAALVARWQWVAVAGHEADDSVHVSLVRADGSGYRELHPDPTLNLGVAAWTPDGEWLACEAWDPSDGTRAGIYIVKVADGSGLAKIARRGIPGRSRLTASDSSSAVEKGDGHRLAVVNLDGTGFAKLRIGRCRGYPGVHARWHDLRLDRDGMGFFDLEGRSSARSARQSGRSTKPASRPTANASFSPTSGRRADYAAIASINVDGTDLQIVVPAIQGEDALHSEQ